MAEAPSLAAVFTPVPRSALVAELTSTRRILQSGQPLETMSRSSEISPAHPVLVEGKGAAAPVSLTFLKQPLAVVQGGSPYVER